MLGRPALSFADNPPFRRLVESTLAARRMVILCGAGVTADAGLPTWPGLLARIARERAERDDELAPLVPANEADLARAAGLLLRRSGPGRSPDYATVASALYDGQPPMPSTYLAQQIVDFVAARRTPTVALATTNYDDVLEVAARTSEFEPVPCSLEAAATWWDAFAAPTDPGLPIFHLHGYLGRDPAQVLHPIVLTEDQFHREGARVQAHLRRMIVEADLVLCLGMSLTDANLVGALASLPPAGGRETSPHARKVFVVSVAGRVAASAGPTQSERYTIQRGEYLRDLFGVEVVPLNGHGQVGQLMVELDLALRQPARYRRPAPSIRYGSRLARGLATAYAAVGWPTDGTAPTGAQLARASDALHEVLEEIRPDLCRLVLRSGHEGLLATGAGPRSTADLPAHVADEGLDLSLWMPTPFTPHAQHAPRPYHLHLVGTSTSSHREHWSFRRPPVAVHAASEDAAAIAAFAGQPVVEPTREAHDPWLWRTTVAVPLTQVPVRGGWGAGVALGAVVLASDRRLPTAEDRAPDRPGEWDGWGREDLAGIAHLDPAGQAAYCRIVLDGVVRLLTGSRR